MSDDRARMQEVDLMLRPTGPKRPSNPSPRRGRLIAPPPVRERIEAGAKW